jgi:hypothetical protein
MKHFGAVSKFAVLLLVLALPAVASAPIITVTPLAPIFVQSGPGGCPSFDVAIVPQQGRPNNGKTITFASGSFIIHGATFVTATNLANSKSINANISGPGHFSVSDNTLTVLGPSLDLGFQNVGPADLPSNIVLAKGQAVLQFDNSGNVTSVSYTGAPPQDVCELLQ